MSILASGLFLANAGCSAISKKHYISQKEGKVMINKYPGIGQCIDLENGRKFFRLKILNTKDTKEGLSAGTYENSIMYEEFIFKDLNCEDILYLLNEDSDFDDIIQRDILTKSESYNKKLHYLEDMNGDGKFNGEDFGEDYTGDEPREIKDSAEGQKLLDSFRRYLSKK